MKETDLFDRLDNVLGNHMENKATEQDVINVAVEINKYLFKYPHPHGVIKEPDSEGMCCIKGR